MVNLVVDTSGFVEEAAQCHLPGLPVQRIGRLLELDAIEQALNIAGDRVRSHNERGVQRMDVFAGHRTLGMADKRRDRHLCKAEVVPDAGKAVTQDVRRHFRQRRLLKQLIPMIGEAAERTVCHS